jgi:hypothetical protein
MDEKWSPTYIGSRKVIYSMHGIWVGKFLESKIDDEIEARNFMKK